MKSAILCEQSIKNFSLFLVGFFSCFFFVRFRFLCCSSSSASYSSCLRHKDRWRSALTTVKYVGGIWLFIIDILCKMYIKFYTTCSNVWEKYPSTLPRLIFQVKFSSFSLFSLFAVCAFSAKWHKFTQGYRWHYIAVRTFPFRCRSVYFSLFFAFIVVWQTIL